MSALAPAAAPGLAITSTDPQAVPPAGGTIVPANMQLGQNPMLPAHPLGQYTDAQFESQDAILRNQIAKQYADLLQKLGYRDQNGNFIQGSVETEANKQQSELARQQALAAEGVTQDAQRNGTLFSGMRGTLQARAEDPYVRQIADLRSATPLQIQQLYEQAAGLTNDYTLSENQLLADAATRAAQGIITNPPGAAAAGFGDASGSTVAGGIAPTGTIGTVAPPQPLSGPTPNLGAIAAAAYPTAGGGGATAPTTTSVGTPAPVPGPAPGSLDAIANSLFSTATGGPTPLTPQQQAAKAIGGAGGLMKAV